MPKLNASWHKAHPMPAKATLDDRVRWHRTHAAACGCREIPKPIRAELSKRGLTAKRRVSGRAPNSR